MPSKRVFLDTSAWLALLNADDSLHPAAHNKLLELGRSNCEITLTDWIIAETGNGVARSIVRLEFVESVRRFAANPKFHVVSISDVLQQKALDLFAKRSDKTWGLVDCASFVVMSEREITEAFTTDRHFEQAGFKCLLPVAGA